MFDDVESVKSYEKVKREQACSDNLCRKNVRRGKKYEKTQQNQEGILCKINLC